MLGSRVLQSQVHASFFRSSFEIEFWFAHLLFGSQPASFRKADTSRDKRLRCAGRHRTSLIWKSSTREFASVESWWLASWCECRNTRRGGRPNIRDFLLEVKRRLALRLADPKAKFLINPSRSTIPLSVKKQPNRKHIHALFLMISQTSATLVCAQH